MLLVELWELIATKDIVPDVRDETRIYQVHNN